MNPPASPAAPAVVHRHTLHRKPAISPLVLTCLVALVATLAVLARQLRAASSALAMARDEAERAAAEAADMRRQLDAMSAAAGAATHAQAALAEARAQLAAARTERDAAREGAAHAHRQRHAFLAGLAHDLRNPLAPLSNGIELLRLTDNDPAGRLRTRGIMERQVGNLMRIADELSDLARLSGDGAQLQHAPFDVGAMLQAMADHAAATLQAQDASLAIDPALARLAPLQGDAQRLAQAFGHLVNDLVRHTERGSVVRLAGVDDDDAVTITVGTAADLDDPQPPALEDVDVAALGLGVALAAQLIGLHHGQLRARRPAGARRVRFIATLPRTRRASPAESPAANLKTPASTAPGDAALTVLLADDNVDFSHSFGTMLELLGHRVEVVHDGLAAVAAIVGAPPDVAFIDIGMPALDGVETVRRVRGQGNTQDVLLVAVTGRGGAEDRARAAEAGFDRYLVKPFAMQDVRDALDAAQAIRSGAVTRPPGSFASTPAA